MPRSRLSLEQRLEIAQGRARGLATTELAARYGVSRQTIHSVIRSLRDAPAVQRADTHTVTVRVPNPALRAFDATAERHGLTRAEALRRLIDAAGTVFLADKDVAGALNHLGAQVNRVGLNLNQIARALNEAHRMGQRVSYGPRSKAIVQEAIGLTIEVTAQVQQMARGQRGQLDVAVSDALRKGMSDDSA